MLLVKNLYHFPKKYAQDQSLGAMAPYPSNHGLWAFGLEGGHSSMKTRLDKLQCCRPYVFLCHIISSHPVRILAKVTRVVSMMAVW